MRSYSRRRDFFRFTAAACASQLLPLRANAQHSTQGHIRAVWGYAAGGSGDWMLRLVAERMSAALGQTVIVDNKVGGGGTIAVNEVLRQPADGQTVLFDTTALATNVSLRKNLPYDVLRDLTPVALVATAPNVLAVSQQTTANSVQEFIRLAKSSSLNYASAGIGSAQHLCAELFCSKTQTKMTHVPFSGGGPAGAAVMAGHVDCYFGNLATLLPMAATGKVKLLGVTSLTRSPAAPAILTIDEQGLPNFEVLEWNGFFVRAGTPPAIVKKINEAVNTALRTADIREKLEARSYRVAGGTAADLDRFVKTQIAVNSKIIREANISLD